MLDSLARSQFEQMAGWFGVRRICRHAYSTQGFAKISLLFILTIWINLPTTSFGQQQPEGFLSIDCGGSGYVDNMTGLEYVSDINSQFILTGMSSMNFSSAIKEPFRFFPERRNKHCYELPTTSNTTYLVRLTFKFQFPLAPPIKFVVYINATNVLTLTYSVYRHYTEPIEWGAVRDIFEGIFYSPGSVMYVCLQPLIGMPIISSLELRPVDSSMYSYPGSERQYLANLNRWNVGANPASAPTAIRYPDDLHDRLWYTPNSGWYDLIPIVSSSGIVPDPNPRPDANNVPPKVMQDAWGGTRFWVRFVDLFPSPPMNLAYAEYAYIVVYAEELDPNSGGGKMSIALDGVPGPDLDISNNASMQVNSNFVLSSDTVNISLSAAASSTVTMNALEIYAQYNFNFSTTDPNDDAAITVLKKSFSLIDWQGDPCTPVPHDWLSCSDLVASVGAPLEQPCSSASMDQCIAQQGFLRTKYSVTVLNFSNMPTQGFTDLQNNAISTDIQLNSLSEMYITGSRVDRSTFLFLVNNLSGGSLTVLDFTNNEIESLPLASDWAGLQNLQSLNLSQNRLAGELSSLEDVPFVSTLQELNLSHNAMSSFPSTWQNTTQTLGVLDLSHNKLVGEISSLNPLVEINAKSLRELYVSNNSLTGTFPSTLYFSDLPNLTIANFDGNSIQGTLNLSFWLDALHANTTRASEILFSFVNNSISSIVPNANAFKSAIDRLRSVRIDFTRGILLGGNPYCKGKKSDIQQFFCRYTIDEEYPKKSNHNNEIMIIGICVGVVVLLLSLITIATMWKFWKQLYALQQIQQALADQKVQPPFYQYNDLKSATKDFHQDNKLGKGGFGEVYKGVLPDKTGLAVKKLFNSRKLQVLNEFLNEVVLITGIKHRNLVQLKGCCIREQQRMLVYEYVENGNVAQALWGSKAYGSLNWVQRFDICVGVARGLSYLHEELQPSIIHRDIKPENILFDKNLKPKIADFGLARHVSEESSQALYTSIAGTLGYFSPEYATQGQLSDKADVYSYGIVVLEVVSGRKCIDHSLSPETVFLKNWVHKMHRKGLLFDVLEPELRDNCVVTEVLRVLNIGLLCVQHDPEKRPSMSQVVTMLLGNMDVEVSLEESEKSELGSEVELKDLWVTTDLQMDYPSLQKVVEDESTDYSYLNLGFESSSSGTSGTQSSKYLWSSKESLRKSLR